MDRENDDDMLAFAIKFALGQHRYAPPKGFDRDPDAKERYYQRIAEAIRDHLKQAWKFERKFDEHGNKRSQD